MVGEEATETHFQRVPRKWGGATCCLKAPLPLWLVQSDQLQIHFKCFDFFQRHMIHLNLGKRGSLLQKNVSVKITCTPFLPERGV